MKTMMELVVVQVVFVILFAGNLLAYTNPSTVVCESWRYGDEGSGGYDHWDLQAVNPKNVFTQGDNITVLAKIEDVSQDHRWRVDFFKGTVLVWAYESDWNVVGSGWGYSSFYPVLENASRGNYTVKISLDTGSGFFLFDEENFTVEGDPYYSPVTYTCESWRYGDEEPGGYDHWDLQPVNPASEFMVGDQVCILSKVKDISEDHRWGVEIFHDGKTILYYTSDWNSVGAGWTYSTVYPCIKASFSGEYQVKVLLDIGGGFTSLYSGSFRVDKIRPKPKNITGHLPAVYHLLLRH